LEEIIRIVRGGDRKSYLIFEAFMHHLLKHIGGCAGVLRGKVDSVILTGGMTSAEYFREQLAERVSWIAPVAIYPGEDETLALVEGTIRALRGIEDAKLYA
jgi:butyrate kinase